MDLARNLREVDADIWILTETHCELSPGPEFCAVSTTGSDRPANVGERWVMIWSRLPILDQFETSDPTRTVCVRVQERSDAAVLVFGTVLPWLGSSWRGIGSADGRAFEAALTAQALDWSRIRAECPADSFCLAGDFNQDLCSRHYYGSRRGRALLRATLSAQGLTCVTSHPFDPVRAATEGSRANIDHICLSASLAKRQDGAAGCWPEPAAVGRKLSDHFGVWADFSDSGSNRTQIEPGRNSA